MRNRPKYRVRIYDEAHLIDRGGFRFTWWRLAAAISLILIIGILIGFSIVWFSPIKRQLPGYLQTEQRSLTEDAYLKVDSLMVLHEVQQEYLQRLLKVLDNEREPDIPDSTDNARPLEPDSLAAASAIEKEFVKRMQQRGYKTVAPALEENDTEQ